MVCTSEDCDRAKHAQVDDQGPNGAAWRAKSVAHLTDQNSLAQADSRALSCAAGSSAFGGLLTHLLTEAMVFCQLHSKVELHRPGCPETLSPKEHNKNIPHLPIIPSCPPLRSTDSIREGESRLESLGVSRWFIIEMGRGLIQPKVMRDQ